MVVTGEKRVVIDLNVRSSLQGLSCSTEPRAVVSSWFLFLWALAVLAVRLACSLDLLPSRARFA